VSDLVARSRAALTLAACLALVAACGTRLPDEAFVAAGGDGAVAGAGSGVGRTGVTTAGGGTTVPGQAPTGATTPTGAGSGDGGAATGDGAAPPGAAPEGGGPAAGPNQASDVGITETTVRIGTIVAENGILGDTFAPAATGLRAWVEHVNAQGGIAGRTLELFTCDDREDRARTLECARRLVEQDQVFALLATNTRSMGGAAQYLQEQGIPVIGMPINNSFYRFSHFFSIYGAQYARDGSAVGFDGQLSNYSTVVRWFKENVGATKAAVFSYDIAESAQAGDFIQATLESEGYGVSRYVVSFAAPSFDSAVADMQRQGTEVIFDAMDDGANRRLCDAMARRQFSVEAKVSTIPAMGDSLGQEHNDTCRPVTFVAGDSLPYTDTSHPLIAAYNDAMGRYQRGKELHQWGLEAWVIGSMLQEALVAMGPAPTRAGFEDHLLAYANSNVGGVMTPTIEWRAGDPAAATVEDCIAVARWSDDSGGWISATPFPYCVGDANQVLTPAAEEGT